LTLTRRLFSPCIADSTPSLGQQVGFSDGFDFVLGGKLPGLFGGDSGSGCTGGKGSEACFSTRCASSLLLDALDVSILTLDRSPAVMWREKGAGEGPCAD